jgi:2-isopropylmalate synthase
MTTTNGIHTPDGVRLSSADWNRQRASSMPHAKYAPAHHRVQLPDLADRRWPNARFTSAPLWVPVDLRDGNQALPNPMDVRRKRRLFDLFVSMGYKEIEIGYPAASSLDFEFVRSLATEGAVPDDVTVVVFTPAIPALIERTLDSVRGMRRVVVHLYIATAPLWRSLVLGRSRQELLTTARDAAVQILAGAERLPGTQTRFQFSPEVFNLTEPDFILELADVVLRSWRASHERPVTLNLPATMEIGTPSVYADQIEYMHRNLPSRDSVILSVHPHNDRGTAVAAAELAVLAGAQRVEGCVFGNGERTGNVDIATLALNLYSEGVNPGIDFGDIDHVRSVVEDCTGMPTPPRHPYVGEYVYTAFSGTHQDAIKKGLDARGERPGDHHVVPWQVPYLHIDPHDVGRDYAAIVRVNSQSGKGGVAYVLQADHGLRLPRGLQIDFAAHVQALSEQAGDTLTSAALRAAFEERYVVVGAASEPAEVIELADHPLDSGTMAYALVASGTRRAWGAARAASADEAGRRAILAATRRLS